MHWTNKYIGLDYKEFNCAELCMKALSEAFGYEMRLPQLPKKLIQMHEMIIDQEPNYPKLEKPFEGCLILMKSRDQLNHIGLYTHINGQDSCLHAMKIAGQTVLHSFQKLDMFGLKIEGFYGWPK